MAIDLRTPKTERAADRFRSIMCQCRQSYGDDMSRWPRSRQRYVADVEAQVIGTLRRETRGQIR